MYFTLQLNVDLKTTILPFCDLRFSESYLVLLLYLNSLNKGSKNPTGQPRSQRHFQKGFKRGAISGIAHKLDSNIGPLVTRRMKQLKGIVHRYLFSGF